MNTPLNLLCSSSWPVFEPTGSLGQLAALVIADPGAAKGNRRPVGLIFAVRDNPAKEIAAVRRAQARGAKRAG